MIYSLSIWILAVIIAIFNDGSFWLRMEIIVLGFLGCVISMWAYNRGWHHGLEAFMTDFAKAADLSVIRELFMKKKVKGDEPKKK